MNDRDDDSWFDIFHLIYFCKTLLGCLFLPPHNALWDEDIPINLWQLSGVKIVNQRGGAYSNKQQSLGEAICGFPRLNHILIIHECWELGDSLPVKMRKWANFQPFDCSDIGIVCQGHSTLTLPVYYSAPPWGQLVQLVVLMVSGFRVRGSSFT